jgi:hypothetical protein
VLRTAVNQLKVLVRQINHQHVNSRIEQYFLVLINIFHCELEQGIGVHEINGHFEFVILALWIVNLTETQNSTLNCYKKPTEMKFHHLRKA